MLRLKRLELQGFKSFCDRTELRFNGGGIAAIVGPNGCGKSNLSDAISWVLGEQSAKSLRGARMEDVIFAGTRDRKPTGMATVTMTLVDPAAIAKKSDSQDSEGIHAAPTSATQASEITITRRLFRSGESEYLIDGHLARLRDIQDLFMGTGLGPESYAIIEQGRIGQILSSRPQDRRAIIEEAAGISKFKTRKRLAEAKLESARQNLARVFDILEEVTRQVNSLKRQASKTRRHGELKAELDARLRVVLSAKFRIMEREAAKAALDLNVAANELRSLAEQVSEREQERERLQSSCYETEAQLTGMRQQLADFQVEIERTRGRLEAQVRESATIGDRIAQGERESQDLEVRSAEFNRERDTHTGALAAFEQQITTTRERMLAKNQLREDLQTQLREQERAIEDGRTAVLRLLGETSTLRNQLAQIDEYLAGIERENARVTKDEQAAAAEIERLARARAELSQTMVRRQMELEAVSGERSRTEEELATQKTAAGELRVQIDTLRAECSHLAARKTSLEDVIAHRTYTTESVKRLFGALEAGQRDGFQPLGVLADFVEVDPLYERAAEEFLHDELEYVVVENWEQAERGMDLLRGELEGRATFLVHEGADSASAELDPQPALPRLSDYLRLTNGLAGRALNLLPRLAHCAVARDRAEAQQLALEHPDFYFLLPDGLCYHGRTLSGGKKTASGPLALKRELREIAITLTARDEDLNQQLGRAEVMDREISTLEGELERLRELQQAGEKASLALDHEMRKLSEETARSNSRISVARLELERLARESERSIEQRDQNREAVEEKERLRSECEDKLSALGEELDTLGSEAEHVSEEHAALRVELAGLEERHRAERAALSRIENQLNEMNSRRDELGREIERLGVDRARLLADNIELDRKAAELAGQIVQTEAEVNRLALDETRLRESLVQSEEKLKELRAELETAHLRRSELEVDLVKKQAELKYLDETSRKELNTPVEELLPAEEMVPDAEALAEAEGQYQEIQRRIEALGPINPQALEEFQECQERHDFLTAQRQDLIDSIRDTEKAIHEIDEVSRQKFAEAYEAINANFREAFRTLFAGGAGEMRLTDETNVAESGIEIIASPPGKRLQNVLLLSGGEKALAALALLMAIFRYQPSPFCVLDEVDAPLDEANIERLMRLLREMSVDTQFIIITHSKRTMESAQSMYGVTMQEAGISRLVSVKFQQMAAAQAAVPAA